MYKDKSQKCSLLRSLGIGSSGGEKVCLNCPLETCILEMDSRRKDNGALKARLILLAYTLQLKYIINLLEEE